LDLGPGDFVIAERDATMGSIHRAALRFVAEMALPDNSIVRRLRWSKFTGVGRALPAPCEGPEPDSPAEPNPKSPLAGLAPALSSQN
jgi:hypothetical protein